MILSFTKLQVSVKQFTDYSTKLSGMAMNPRMTASSPRSTYHITSSAAIGIIKSNDNQIPLQGLSTSSKMDHMCIVEEKTKSKALAVRSYLSHLITSWRAWILVSKRSAQKDVTLHGLSIWFFIYETVHSNEQTPYDDENTLGILIQYRKTTRNDILVEPLK